MNDWNIQARSRHCQACEKGFIDQQAFHTLLFDEKHDFRRLDICDPCWQGQYSQGASDRKGFISYWHGVYEAPPATAPDPIQKENAESLLRKLIELNDPKYAAVGYILAVMLERKRLLKVKEQLVRDGQRVFIYEHPRSGDIFTISDPNLQLTQLEKVQHDVAALLEHGFSPAAMPEPTPAQSGAPQTDGTPETVLGTPPAGASASIASKQEPAV